MTTAAIKIPHSLPLVEQLRMAIDEAVRRSGAKPTTIRHLRVKNAGMAQFPIKITTAGRRVTQVSLGITAEGLESVKIDAAGEVTWNGWSGATAKRREMLLSLTSQLAPAYA